MKIKRFSPALAVLPALCGCAGNAVAAVTSVSAASPAAHAAITSEADGGTTFTAVYEPEGEYEESGNAAALIRYSDGYYEFSYEPGAFTPKEKAAPDKCVTVSEGEYAGNLTVKKIMYTDAENSKDEYPISALNG